MICQVTMSTEAAISLVIAGFTAIAGALGFVFRLLINNLTADRDNWKQVATEAVGNLRKAANEKRVKQGKEPYEDLADVVPEHSSPVTKQQEEVAELQTVRAALVAATLDLGLPARGTDVTSKAVEVAEKAVELADQLAVEQPTPVETDITKSS